MRATEVNDEDMPMNPPNSLLDTKRDWIEMVHALNKLTDSEYGTTANRIQLKDGAMAMLMYAIPSVTQAI